VEKTYTIGERKFVMRPFNLRDILRVTGKMGLLPTEVLKRAATPEERMRNLDTKDQLLVRCSRRPKLTLEEYPVTPDGTMPVAELTDAEYSELFTSLATDSGYTMEAAEEIRPTSEAPAS